MQEKNIPAPGSLLMGINSRCEPGDASRKHSEGAFSGGGIHHLRRPDAKASERCWSQLMISPPERCPVCVKHLPAHNGVLPAIKLLCNHPPFFRLRYACLVPFTIAFRICSD